MSRVYTGMYLSSEVMGDHEPGLSIICNSYLLLFLRLTP